MSLKGGWKAAHTSDDVPERDYRVKGIEYIGPIEAKKVEGDNNKWANEYLKIAIIDEPVQYENSADRGQRPDKEVIGRRIKIYLGNELRGHAIGYMQVSMALQLDGDRDIKGEELVGLPFEASFFYKDSDDPKSDRRFLNCKPIIDYDWVNDQEAPKGGKKGTKKKASSSRRASKSQSSEARRQRRRQG